MTNAYNQRRKKRVYETETRLRHQFTISIPLPMIKWLGKMAKKDGRSRSSVVEMAVNHYKTNLIEAATEIRSLNKTIEFVEVGE